MEPTTPQQEKRIVQVINGLNTNNEVLLQLVKNVESMAERVQGLKSEHEKDKPAALVEPATHIDKLFAAKNISSELTTRLEKSIIQLEEVL